MIFSAIDCEFLLLFEKVSCSMDASIIASFPFLFFNSHFRSWFKAKLMLDGPLS